MKEKVDLKIRIVGFFVEESSLSGIENIFFFVCKDWKDILYFRKSGNIMINERMFWYYWIWIMEK